MQDALNAQINAEIFSSYLYYAMAAHFHYDGWQGMAKWMEKQAAEEESHAMKIYDHLIERGGRVIYEALEKPQTEWESPLAVFKAAQKHEEYITSRINDLFKLAREEKDYPAEIMLQWFVKEQVEEEASVGEIVQIMERMGESGHGLIMLDMQLGKRE